MSIYENPCKNALKERKEYFLLLKSDVYLCKAKNKRLPCCGKTRSKGLYLLLKQMFHTILIYVSNMVIVILWWRKEMWEHLTLALITRDLIRWILALAYILESWLNGSASSVLTQLFPAGYSMIHEPRGGTEGKAAVHFESDLIYNRSLFWGEVGIIQVYPLSTRIPVKIQKPWWSADLHKHLAKDLLSELAELQTYIDLWCSGTFEPEQTIPLVFSL